MISLIGASVVFCCDENFGVIEDGAVAFKCDQDENEIIEVGEYKTLSKKYKNHIFYEECALLPAFINSHIHFEFSKNSSSFEYGNFASWLTSVIKNRENVLEDIEDSLKLQIKNQLKSGVGSVGAISSYGLDLEALANSPLRVVYFNEVLGAKPQMVDFLYQNFISRLETSQKYKSDRFSPAIAIHSPYSTHDILLKKAIELAKKESLIVSCHFLESAQELEWLQKGSGWFEDFFIKALDIKKPKPFYTQNDFINSFDGIHTLFAHCLFASKEEISKINKIGTIVHCPRSNRLLNNTYFDLANALNSNIAIATDGLSSNNTLSMLDELRVGVFAYPNVDINTLSKTLILGATKNGAHALKLNNGELKEGRIADLAIFKCDGIKNSSQPWLHFILNAKDDATVYINGKEIVWK